VNERGRQRVKRLYTSAAIHWLNTTILFACVIAACTLAMAIFDWWRGRDLPAAPRYNARALKSMSPSAARKVFAVFTPDALAYEYRPWVGHGDRVVQTEQVHVDESAPIPIRRTVSRGRAGGTPRRIWLFGGSTSFGLGVPDDQTIATHLQSALRQALPGLDVRVVNHAHVSYYSSQEVALMEWLIRSGQHTDVAVFLDGLNESWHPLDVPDDTPTVIDAFESSRHVISLTQRFAPARLVRTLLNRSSSSRLHVQLSPRETAHRAAMIYFRNVNMALAIAGNEGIRVLFVWQPTPFDEFGLSSDPAEAWIRAPWAENPLTKLLDAAVWAEFDRSPDMVWLAGIFRGRRFLDTYVDTCHYGDQASAILANAIAREIVSRGYLR
jgi:hypothetical protein